MVFGLLKNIATAGRRAFGNISDVVRKFGTTAHEVSRTLNGHKGNLKSFVSDLGSNFAGYGGHTMASVVNKGLDHAPDIIKNVGTKLHQVSDALHPKPF